MHVKSTLCSMSEYSDSWWKQFLQWISLRAQNATAHLCMNAVNKETGKPFSLLKQCLEEDGLLGHHGGDGHTTSFQVFSPKERKKFDTGVQEGAGV